MRRLGAILIIAVCLGSPILEMVDSWDHTAQDGHDIEGSVVVLALCVGVGLIGVAAALGPLRPLSEVRTPAVILAVGFPLLLATAPPIPTASPPRILRI